MNHSELLRTLSKRLNLHSDDVSNKLSATVNILSMQLIKGNVLTIPQLGTFEVKKRNERISVHPATGKRFLVPPKSVVGFKPVSSLKDKIQEDSADE